MDAVHACRAAAEGVKDALGIGALCLPVSDGGEGFAECLAAALACKRGDDGREDNLQERRLIVEDPLGRPVQARYFISSDGGRAYMDAASACGMNLLGRDELEPMDASTRGVGMMLQDAVDCGCTDITIGLGGSATTDCGAGMLETLGLPLPAGVHITAAVDVDAPLYGPMGAAYVFAPQKGAGPHQVELLDLRLRDFARRCEAAGKADAQMALIPGAGAAGGLGYALSAVVGGRLIPGAGLFLRLCGAEAIVEGTDMILTGEGKSDAQTLMGKVPMAIMELGRRHGIPVHLFSGVLQDAPKLTAAGFSSIHCINDGCSLPEEKWMAPEVAEANLRVHIADFLAGRQEPSMDC